MGKRVKGSLQFSGQVAYPPCGLVTVWFCTKTSDTSVCRKCHQEVPRPESKSCLREEVGEELMKPTWLLFPVWQMRPACPACVFILGSPSPGVPETQLCLLVPLPNRNVPVGVGSSTNSRLASSESWGQYFSKAAISFYIPTTIFNYMTLFLFFFFLALCIYIKKFFCLHWLCILVWGLFIAVGGFL